MNRLPKQMGFTLVESIVVLLIGSVLVSMVLPSLLDMIKDNRLVSLNNDMVSDLALARSTAITRGTHATLCASNEVGRQCVPNVLTWENGWIVFEDSDNDGVVDTGESIIAVKNNIHGQTQIITDNSKVSYDAEGFAFGSAIEFAFCDDRGETAKKGLIVIDSGRSRSAQADDISVSCP